jgi:hypothetical protein
MSRIRRPELTTTRGRWRRLRQATLLLTLVVGTQTTAVACAGCAAALLPGVLVAQGSELAIKEDTAGFIRPIRWPFGYSVRPDSNGLVLTDLFGNVKAREGDHVGLPGGETSSDGPWGVCGEIQDDEDLDTT